MLSLVIEYHTEIIVINYTDVKAWTILHIWIDRFCTSIRTVKVEMITLSFSLSTQTKLWELNNV